MATKISIQDYQFNSEKTDEKLRRLMDDLRRIVRSYNDLVDEFTTLKNTPHTDVSPHELAGTDGIGASHTVSGLTAGQVLIADSATDAVFRKLRFTDIDQTDFGSPTNGDVIKYLDGYYVLGPVTVSLESGTGIVIAGSTISVDASELDHGSLLGLGDDDHPQYLLKSSVYKHFLFMGA